MKNIPDQNDGKEWSLMDLEDLRDYLTGGMSVEDVAVVLCRSGTKGDVEAKAREMGWLK